MKVKFNKIERIAGLFITVALVGAVLFTGLAAIKKGWLQTKVNYKTKIVSAEGLRPGTPVTISGIRAGEITDIELFTVDNIVLHFSVFDKFQKQIRKDSKVIILRPFVIGDKSIEITVGSHDQEMLEKNSFIESETMFDMMDLMNGKKIGPFLGNIEGLIQNISRLATAFADPKRTEALIKMFDRMEPLIVSINKMSIEVTKTTSEINRILPQINAESPKAGQQIGQLITHLNKISNAVVPAFDDLGPELPRVSRRAVEALDEMVITLKAIQKSFLLSGKVEDVKAEEIERKRKPASK